jgi:hypothetical protein
MYLVFTVFRAHDTACYDRYISISNVYLAPTTVGLKRWLLVMETKVFGVPLIFWGILCLALTVVWVVVWPSDRVTPTSAVQFFILRWFHALTWLFLAIAAFIAAFNLLGGVHTAKRVAFLSLVTYLIFMGTVVTSSARP